MAFSFTPQVMRDANGNSVRIKSATGIPGEASEALEAALNGSAADVDGNGTLLGDGNWTLENLYWNLYGSPDRAALPYVFNFACCFYAYLFRCVGKLAQQS